MVMVPAASWGLAPLFSPLCPNPRVIPADYLPMEDFDLRTFGRNVLLLVTVLSVLVIGEMILVSAEEPATSVQQQVAYKAPR